MRAFYLTMIRLMIIGTLLILIMSHFTMYTAAIKHMEPPLYELKEKEVSIQEKGDKRNDHSKN
ncbi:hypothetical protein J2S09_002985 [Bacillus fengqiuensis]|nr:hypothetical protein [Bacillus fengqiuensis]